MIVALNFISLCNELGSGTVHYIQNLLTVMGEYDLHDTHFIVYKQPQISSDYFCMPANADVEYINVLMLDNRWKRIVFEQTLFYKYIKPCDVFYSYCTSLPLFVRAKRVFTLHDVYYISNPERYGWLQRTYIALITRIYCRRVDEVLTVSQYSKQQIEKHIPAAKGKVRLTYNVLSGREVAEQPVNIESKPYFLFVGSIQPSKNIVRMVDAFKTFNHDGQYHLYVVGKPLYASEPILAHVQATENVTYLGYLSDREIAYLYHRAEAVVLLSLCEGFGIPPLEGFNYGKPALVSDATSLPEVVGEAGVKVNPLDVNAIARGFGEVLTRKEELVSHAAQQIEKFDKNVSCETWMNSLQINFSR